MDVHEAIRRAERILPGRPLPGDGLDPRWQAIIAVGEHIEDRPEDVWKFVERWGVHEDEDLRAAVATCLLEHLLEHHFEYLFPRIEVRARSDPRFASTVAMCWKLGRATQPANAARLDRLIEETK